MNTNIKIKLNSSSTPKQSNTTSTLPVIQIHELKKVYRTGFWLNQKVESLKGCSVSVYHGETFGLLGPNGAGKTTLLKLLLGIIRPSAGRGVLLGQPLGDRTSKQKIGYLPENAYYYDYLTGWELLEMAAGLFQLPSTIQRQRIPELLELVGLAHSVAKKKQLRQYSKGMLQRIGLAQALINDPEVVFLDEPMSGLDPIGRYQMRKIILSLKDLGKTIFFNSHILSEVEQICDRIAILAQGELICTGSLEELLGKPNTYSIKGKGGDRSMLHQWLHHLIIEPDGSWHGQLQQLQAELDEFLIALRQTDAQLIAMNLSRLSLEEFFLQQLQQRGLASFVDVGSAA